MALAVFARHPTWTRFALRWLLSLHSARDALVDGTPWIPYRAAEWLESYLKPSMNVFEWGSGGSTIFIARRVKQLVAIEDSPLWEARIAAMLRRCSITNCDLRLVGADAPCAEGKATGKAGFSSLWGDEATSFERYVKRIEAYPDEHFDLVSVDGHARLACIARAASKVRPGGCIMLDNAGIFREEASRILTGWRTTVLSGPAPYHPYAYANVVWRRPVGP